MPLHDFLGTIAARVAHPREPDILAQLLDPQDIVMRAVNPVGINRRTQRRRLPPHPVRQKTRRPAPSVRTK